MDIPKLSFHTEPLEPRWATVGDQAYDTLKKFHNKKAQGVRPAAPQKHTSKVNEGIADEDSEAETKKDIVGAQERFNDNRVKMHAETNSGTSSSPCPSADANDTMYNNLHSYQATTSDQGVLNGFGQNLRPQSQLGNLTNDNHYSPYYRVPTQPTQPRYSGENPGSNTFFECGDGVLRNGRRAQPMGPDAGVELDYGITQDEFARWQAWQNLEVLQTYEQPTFTQAKPQTNLMGCSKDYLNQGCGVDSFLTFTQRNDVALLDAQNSGSAGSLATFESHSTTASPLLQQPAHVPVPNINYGDQGVPSQDVEPAELFSGTPCQRAPQKRKARGSTQHAQGSKRQKTATKPPPEAEEVTHVYKPKRRKIASRPQRQRRMSLDNLRVPDDDSKVRPIARSQSAAPSAPRVVTASAHWRTPDRYPSQGPADSSNLTQRGSSGLLLTVPNPTHAALGPLQPRSSGSREATPSSRTSVSPMPPKVVYRIVQCSEPAISETLRNKRSLSSSVSPSPSNPRPAPSVSPYQAPSYLVVPPTVNLHAPVPSLSQEQNETASESQPGAPHRSPGPPSAFLAGEPYEDPAWFAENFFF